MVLKWCTNKEEKNVSIYCEGDSLGLSRDIDRAYESFLLEHHFRISESDFASSAKKLILTSYQTKNNDI